jgi:hypothetical protein
MNLETSHGGHSADVRMRLLVNSLSLRVGELGSDFLVLDSPMDHAPTVASIILQIDDSEQRWNVFLPNGISTASKRVALACA